jgi:hypothetical protein
VACVPRLHEHRAVSRTVGGCFHGECRPEIPGAEDEADPVEHELAIELQRESVTNIRRYRVSAAVSNVTSVWAAPALRTQVEATGLQDRPSPDVAIVPLVANRKRQALVSQGLVA